MFQVTMVTFSKVLDVPGYHGNYFSKVLDVPGYHGNYFSKVLDFSGFRLLDLDKLCTLLFSSVVIKVIANSIDSILIN